MGSSLQATKNLEVTDSTHQQPSSAHLSSTFSREDKQGDGCSVFLFQFSYYKQVSFLGLFKCYDFCTFVLLVGDFTV
jgi:hypothetical protein